MFNLIPFTNDNNSLFRYLDDMEKNLSNGFGDFSQFRCDIKDQGDQFLLEAELPGFQKEDISIDINGDSLNISAKHNTETENKGENYVRRERKFGSFSRSFDITGIETSQISAAYNNGILELLLPKKQKVVPASHSIEIQ